MRAEVDFVFGKYPHLQWASSFNSGKWGKYVNRAFRIKGDYEWRPTTIRERLYHRLDGYIGLSVELLRAGLRFPLHKFLVELFVQHFKCVKTQFSRNAIWWILWYIAPCHRRKLHPTFKGFFPVFREVKWC